MECRINEIHPCHVGESLASGLPAVLVRFAGCSVRCVYCDTRYAQREPASTFTVSQVLEKVEALGLDRLLITGGEPLEQEEATVMLCNASLKRGYSILLETSGTCLLSPLPEGVIRIVDVKPPGAKAKLPFLQENLALLRPQDQLKFVLTSRADFEWALSFLQKNRPALAPSHILFSPVMGLLKPAQLSSWMLERSVAYRFHVQIHKFVWGDRRGV